MKTPDLFEDSTVGAATLQPKAPHDFRLSRQPREHDAPLGLHMRCIICWGRMNEAGEFCPGKPAVK